MLQNGGCKTRMLIVNEKCYLRRVSSVCGAAQLQRRRVRLSYKERKENGAPPSYNARHTLADTSARELYHGKRSRVPGNSNNGRYHLQNIIIVKAP